PTAGGKRKEPPGNRAALPLGRIVPTEAKPSELSGCIVGSGFPGVKDYSEEFNSIVFKMLRDLHLNEAQQSFRPLFAFLFPLFTGFLPGFLEFCTVFPQGIRLVHPSDVPHLPCHLTAGCYSRKSRRMNSASYTDDAGLPLATRINARPPPK